MDPAGTTTSASVVFRAHLSRKNETYRMGRHRSQATYLAEATELDARAEREATDAAVVCMEELEIMPDEERVFEGALADGDTTRDTRPTDGKSEPAGTEAHAENESLTRQLQKDSGRLRASAWRRFLPRVSIRRVPSQVHVVRITLKRFLIICFTKNHRMRDYLEF